MHQDPSKQVDPEHPAMRALGAFFDTAIECGLTMREVLDIAHATLDACDPGETRISELMTAAFAQRLEDAGLCDAAEYRQLVELRTEALLREAGEALGIGRTD